MANRESSPQSQQNGLNFEMFKLDCLALFGAHILDLKEEDLYSCLKYSYTFNVKSKIKKKSLFSTMQ